MARATLVSHFVAFCFFGVLLTSSALFAAVIASIQPFFECMRVRDASMLFLESSWDFLTRSGLCVGLLESSTTLSMRVHTSDGSLEVSSLFGSPTRGSAPVAGKARVFDVTDVFAGVFEALATLCMHVRV